MESTLKVAYILNRFPFFSETFIMREMYWLRKQGTDVRIFSLRSPQDGIIHHEARELLAYTYYAPFLSWEIIKAQFYFIRRSPQRYLRSLMKSIRQTHRERDLLLGIVALFPKVVYWARQMEQIGIEHIHAHFAWLQGIAAGIVSDLIDVTFTIHPHAFALFMRPKDSLRLELENATKVIAVSTFHRKYIADLSPGIDAKDIEIVHYGIDLSRFRATRRRPNPGLARILCVGRIVLKKGHNHLIDACAELAKRGLRFECHIVGDGPYVEDLQSQIEQHALHNQVRLLGAQGEKQVIAHYQKSDIFALPCIRTPKGDQDGMPNVLIEAMACQLPVVTTPLTGIPDLVQNGVNGLLVREHDVSGLADALECLIKDEPLRWRLGKQAYKTIVEEYQIQDSAAKLARIFNEMNHKILR